MNWKISAFSILGFAFLAGCNPDTHHSDNEVEVQFEEYASRKYLIEPEELAELLNNQHAIKLIDVRKPTHFSKGHIRGAVNIWRNQITDTSFDYGGMMPNKTQMEKLFGELGIAPSDTLIIYDDKAECDAARLWWICKFYGHQNMKLLNGGLKAWSVLDSSLSFDNQLVVVTDYQFYSEADSSILMNYQVLKLLEIDSTVTLVDTRNIAEYAGEELKDGAARAGHILGAKNLDWAASVNYSGNHKFLPVSDLKLKFSSIGIDGTKPIVSYCHSGVRSAHTLFVLTELLGYKEVRNYDGSWTEWSHLTPE